MRALVRPLPVVSAMVGLLLIVGASRTQAQDTAEHLRSIVDANPDSFSHAIELVDAYLREDRVREAEAELARARTLDSAVVSSVRFAQARIHEANGRLDAACAELRTALAELRAAVAEGDAGALEVGFPWLRLAELEAACGNADAAWEAYYHYASSAGYLPHLSKGAVLKRAVEFAPQDKLPLWRELERVFGGGVVHDYAEQTRDVEQLLERYPDEPALLRIVACRPYERHQPMVGRDHAQCVKTARKLVSIEPDVAYNWWVLAYCLEGSGYYEEAYTMYNEALAHIRDPDNLVTPQVNWQLVHVFLMLGRYGEALDLYEAGYEGGYITPDAGLASVIWAAERYEDGVAHFRALRLADEQAGRDPWYSAVTEAAFVGLAGDLDGMQKLLKDTLAADDMRVLSDYDSRIEELVERETPEALLTYLEFLIAADGSVPGVPVPDYREALESVIAKAPDVTLVRLDLLELLMPVLRTADGTEQDRAEAERIAEELIAAAHPNTYVARRAKELLEDLRGMPDAADAHGDAGNEDGPFGL